MWWVVLCQDKAGLCGLCRGKLVSVWWVVLCQDKAGLCVAGDDVWCV